MQRINYQGRPNRATVTTIGNFDGVHLGHQKLITKSQELAHKLNLDLVAMTFDPHPLQVLRPDGKPYLLTPLELKLEYLGRFGVPWVDVVPFTKHTAATEPLVFLEEYLAERLKTRAVVVGYNFTFGAGGLGTPHTIREWGRSRSIQVEVLSPVSIAGDRRVVSSSAIRDLIRRGAVNEAEALLGHPFVVQGEMVSGDGRGRTMGVPTANILPPPEQIMPPYGVYAGMLQTTQGRHQSVANWGVRPTFGGIDPVLEIHVLDPGNWQFSGRLEFEFIAHLRAEQKFATKEALVDQIGQDVEQARQRLLGLV